ncbi:GNAT family N-acetyltransferase [Kribbella shirazensis]|uniref:GNAT superfamily N-acetyltransferase n=1 Tax=Kribbella shirazensis TaxID=1105143 RepID=A0A7X6A4A3_9ACTN|nr:GNAT family N-acetyltransferase [Kribbella shirazensis]NIK60768.1 GNAT superfamily N-acetyltransferase [Kribbella shirazensis]
MTVTQYEAAPYESGHLQGILAICEAEDWPSLPADPARAHAVFTAPGVTTVVALDGEQVVGFAYLLSDGHLQAYLSQMAVHRAHRRKGIGRAMIEYATPLTGAQRVDLLTDTAQDFYTSFEHRMFSGFRIYPS